MGWRSRLGRIGLGVVAVLGVDLLSGLVHNTGTGATVSVLGDVAARGGRVVLLLPGHIMSGRLMAQAFLPHLRPADTVVTVDWAQRGVDLDAVYAAVRRELDALRPGTLVVYGVSMGGVVAAGLLRRYAADGAPYGRVRLVLDAAPASAADVRRPGVLFDLSCVYRGGVISTLGWALGASLAPQPTPEPDADAALVARGRTANIWVGMPAVSSQACLVARARPPVAGELDGVVASAAYLYGEPADGDPVIDVPRALTSWRRALPGLVEVPVPTRQARWHAPLVERPAETVAAIEQALAR